MVTVEVVADVPVDAIVDTAVDAADVAADAIVDTAVVDILLLLNAFFNGPGRSLKLKPISSCRGNICKK